MTYSELIDIVEENFGTRRPADIANEFGVTPQVVNNWKARNQVPYKYVRLLRKKIDDKLLIKAVNYDLAITRSGASVVSELSYLNIPFVAIPFPYAKDNHQYYNADFYKKKNCCWLIMQKDINENNFINLLNNIFENQNEYFSKKNNLIQLTKEDTWEKNKVKLTKLINEN